MERFIRWADPKFDRACSWIYEHREAIADGVFILFLALVCYSALVIL